MTQPAHRSPPTIGFHPQSKKTELTPSCLQQFLGFEFNTRDMNIRVPLEKNHKLESRFRQVIKPQPCRWMAALLRKIKTIVPAIGDALLDFRYIQRDLAKALHRNGHNWNKTCHPSDMALEDIHWWSSMTTLRKGLPIIKPPSPPSIATIFVDASNSGLGIKSPSMKTAGFWGNDESSTSINSRKLKTILFALILHQKDHANQSITLKTDSITALK